MRQDSTLFHILDGALLAADNAGHPPAELRALPDSLIAAAPDSTAVLSTAGTCVPPEALYGTRATLVAQRGNAATVAPRLFKAEWFEGGIALAIIVLFIVFFRHIRAFSSMLFSGLASYRVSEKQFVENSLSAVITIRTLLFFSFISIGFFCWLLWPAEGTAWGNFSSQTLSPWYFYIFITGGLSLFMLLKLILMYAIDYAGMCRPLMHMAAYFGRLSIIACGLLLFPASMLIAASDPGLFLDVLLIVSFVLAGLNFLLYFFRIIQIFFNAHASIFFLILYLCTFEIAPIVVLYSFIVVS